MTEPTPESLSARIADLVGKAYVQGWADSRQALMFESVVPTPAQVVRYFQKWIDSGELKL